MRKIPNSRRRLDEDISRALNKRRKPSTAEEITELLNRDLELEDRPFQTKDVAEWLRDTGDTALTLYWSRTRPRSIPSEVSQVIVEVATLAAIVSSGRGTCPNLPTDRHAKSREAHGLPGRCYLSFVPPGRLPFRPTCTLSCRDSFSGLKYFSRSFVSKGRWTRR